MSSSIPILGSQDKKKARQYLDVILGHYDETVAVRTHVFEELKRHPHSVKNTHEIVFAMREVQLAVAMQTATITMATCAVLAALGVDVPEPIDPGEGEEAFKQ